MRVFLSGFMAAGKTTVGRELARHLGVPFVDLDASIEHRESSRIEEIFARGGEEAFRDLESEELARLAAIEPLVVALGGGTLERCDNLRLVRGSGLLVWLDTPRSTILRRLERTASERPLYADRDQALRLLDERLATYEQCDLRLRPLDEEMASGVAARIAALI